MLSNLADKKIILASKSPRRQELLKGLGLDFEIRTKDVDETFPSTLEPLKVPAFLAEKKADAFFAELNQNEILITSDTLVFIENEILEKPLSFEDAQKMLRKISGKTHTVITAVCISTLNKRVVFSDQTNVTFSNLTNDEIDFYITNYKPYDKAGSYGAQDWIGLVGIKKLEGSYFTVMGLPVHRLYQELKEF